jgi:8-oxo-dGTP pyrophosphatase MutT (NUDIX family)
VNPSDSLAQSSSPRPSATVLLLRQGRKEVEVLVIRRHENLAFMGGLWVFPGGALSAFDMAGESLERIPEQSKARCARFTDLYGHALDVDQCMGLAVAAYRETFEETGVLLARTAEGDHCADDLLIRVQEQRRTIVSQPERFAALLREENLLLDVDRLLYWAHWITPSIVPRRFDTRFFLATVPAQQTATIDAVEAVEHAWRSASTLIEAANSGVMPVSQPTLYNLMELDACLRRHGSLDALVSAETRRHVAPVLPKLIRAQRTVMVLPWDSDYRNVIGESVPAHVIYSSTLQNLPSRMTQRP